MWRAGCLWLRAGDLLLRVVYWLLRGGSDRHCDECQKNDRRTCHTQLSLSKSLDKANCRWRRGRCVERASRSVCDADSKSRSVSQNACMRPKITSARRRSASTNLFGARSRGTFLSICPGAIANDAKRRVKRLETGTSDRIVATRMPSVCLVFGAEHECCLSLRCWRVDSFINVESPGVSHMHVGAEALVQHRPDVYRGCVRRAWLRASRLPVHWPCLRRRARSA